jgi:two-component system, OmpR family, alkaline phosphatase synthesis response regulator PhoP
MTQRILVVDDDKQIVRLVKTYLEEANFSVLTAFDGDDALRVVRHERPDLIVLDVQLPGHDGWEITRHIRSEELLQTIPILMLTARVEDTDKILGLELGADDYLTKPFNPREVVARVRAILRRTNHAPTGSRILQQGTLRLDLDQHRLTLENETIELTPTEFTLLKTFMENPRHAFTRQELIEKSMGYAYEGLDRTLDSHIKNLRKKIEVDAGEPRYIETVFGVGYRFRVPEGAA